MGHRAQLRERRRFLIQAAGGTIALLFGLPRPAQSGPQPTHDPWATLDAVTRQLLPSEPDSPGAAEIHALDYLRFVAADPKIDAEEREFIVQGCRWLDDLAVETYGRGFVALGNEDRERLLRRTAGSAAGENWLSTLLSYLLEALLTAPAYGGNPRRVGWQWLEYVAGYPLPEAGTRYFELPL